MRNEEPKVPFAPILVSAYSAVASCKLQVARNVTSCDGIGHWALGIGRVFDAVIGLLVYWCIGGRALALHFAGMNSRLQKYALQSNAPTSIILHPKFNIKCVAQQRLPKSSIFHLPSSIRSRDRNPMLHSSRFLVTSYSLLVSTRFLTPHSSFLIFAPKGAN